MKLTIGWDFPFKLQTVLNNNLLLGAILKAAIAGMVSKQKCAAIMAFSALAMVYPGFLIAL